MRSKHVYALATAASLIVASALVRAPAPGDMSYASATTEGALTSSDSYRAERALMISDSYGATTRAPTVIGDPTNIPLLLARQSGATGYVLIDLARQSGATASPQLERAPASGDRVSGPFVPAERLDLERIKAEQEAMVPTGLNGMPFAPEGLTNCEEFDFYRDQAGLPVTFRAVVWRESNCRNDVHNSCCWGYLSQFYRVHMADRQGHAIYARCEVAAIADYYGDEPLAKQKQVCVAKGLYDAHGMAPWRLTKRRRH